MRAQFQPISDWWVACAPNAGNRCHATLREEPGTSLSTPCGWDGTVLRQAAPLGQELSDVRTRLAVAGPQTEKVLSHGQGWLGVRHNPPRHQHCDSQRSFPLNSLLFGCSLVFLQNQPVPFAPRSWQLKPSPSPRQHYEEESAPALRTPCNFNALSVSRDTKNNQSDTIPRCGAGCTGAARDGPCLCPSLGRCSDRNTLVSQSIRTHRLMSPALAGFLSQPRSQWSCSSPQR